MSALPPILDGLKVVTVTKWRAEIWNLTFQLFRMTYLLLLFFATISTGHKHFGYPIFCDPDKDAVPLEVFESYCLMEGSYTLLMEEAATATMANTSTLHHGLGHGLGKEDSRNGHQNYYIWANLIMVLLAALNYLPWAAWKAMEGGRVTRLLAKVSRELLTETPVEEQVGPLSDFLLSHRGWFNGAALKLLLCQAGCLLAALAQLYLLDQLLGNRFLALGGATLDPALLRRALSTTFPTVVMCTMSLFGPSGTLSTVSGICTLPLNIIHDKIFLVLWFWLVGLALVALVQLARQTALLSSALRPYLAPTLASEAKARRLVTSGSYGDTVLLEIIAANLDQVQVETLVGLLLRHHERPTNLPTTLPTTLPTFHTPLLSHHLTKDRPQPARALKGKV